MNNIKQPLINCPFCNAKDLSTKSFLTHLKNKHPDKKNLKEVYDSFFKKEEEGKCKTCGKKTPFSEKSFKYRNYCSEDCQHKDMARISKEKSEIKLTDIQQEEICSLYLEEKNLYQRYQIKLT